MLPIFLGVVGCLCGGVLSLTNFITKDKIAEGEFNRANEAYFKHFEGYKAKEEMELSSTLISSGVTLKEKIFDSEGKTNVLGYIYTCSVTGFAGKNSPITFSISYADGKINQYVTLSHSESSQGAKFMDWLSQDNHGDRASNLEEGKVISGSSTSYGAVNAAISACTADYLSFYRA